MNTAAGGRRRRARRAAAGRPTSGHVRFACGEVRQRLATSRQAPALGVLANTARFWAACQHRNSEPQEPAFAGSTRRCLILTLLAAEAIDQVVGACHWQGYRLSGRRVQGPCSRQAGSRRRTSCAAWRAGTCLQVVEFSEAGLAPVSPPLLARRVGHARRAAGAGALQSLGARQPLAFLACGTPSPRHALTQANCCQQGSPQQPHNAAALHLRVRGAARSGVGAVLQLCLARLTNIALECNNGIGRVANATKQTHDAP